MGTAMVGLKGSLDFVGCVLVPAVSVFAAPALAEDRGGALRAEGLALLLMCESVFCTYRSDPAALAAPYGTVIDQESFHLLDEPQLFIFIATQASHLPAFV